MARERFILAAGSRIDELIACPQQVIGKVVPIQVEALE
jgi:hypothetical protein